MIRDPFYRAIESRLGENLDADVFERCAADVLRTIYPSLVPIPGGDDGGMDGAIAAEGGLPIPLVTTTGRDATANLRRNLNSYLRRGGRRRTIVFATSQSLTARRRQNLEKAATELGFTVLQVHDRSSFADLLYRQPRWCRELLGLTGEPPSLSVIPTPGRPLLGEGLIGRSSDIQWLTDTAGDLLILGQPGVGKTFLLYHFAKANEGLFVHTANLTDIAAGVREARPAVLIVDDAHLCVDLLAQLRRIRVETGATFRIIAVSWPGGQDEAMRALDISSSSVRVLELVSRDEIAQIVKSVGIAGPPQLIQEIVNQAEGRPGLAVTLANLCLRDDARAMVEGEALAREIGVVFDRLTGRDVAPLLAAFAVGGDAGMAMQDVAMFLGEPLTAVRERTAKLAAGGVLIEVQKERLAVRPPALRHVLVGRVFFAGATALPIESLLYAVGDQDELMLTLIGARQRGAQVPSVLLRSVIVQSRSSAVWAALASVGPDEVNWINAAHPQWLARIGRAALPVAPEIVLPPLFRAAIGDTRALHSTTDHPMRIVSDWVVGAHPGTPSVMERRRALLQAAESWLRSGGDPSVGLRALSITMSPEFQRVDPVPGSGRAITLTHGFVTLEDARRIRALWPRVRASIAAIDVELWSPLREMVNSWAHPGAYHPVPDDLRAESRAFAAAIVGDLAALGAAHPGIVQWACGLARQLGVTLEQASADDVFETLFPQRDNIPSPEELEAQANRVRVLADEWSRRPHDEIARLIVSYEREAQLAAHTWPRLTPLLCNRIAEVCAAPEPWLEALLGQSAQPDVVQPFLGRSLKEGGDRGGELARRCLAIEGQRLATAITLLTSTSTQPELLEAALNNLNGGAEWITTLCLRREFSEPVLLRLLTHADDSIASAAAIGIWQGAFGGEIPPDYRTEWTAAILRGPGDDWNIREILKRDKRVAAEWIMRQVCEDGEAWPNEDAIGAAFDRMSAEQRHRFLPELRAERISPTMVAALIGNDLDLYRELLATQLETELRLAPLAGRPNGAEWADKALAALDGGSSEDEVVRAAFGTIMSWTGDESAMWSEWVDQFGALSAHPNPRIRSLGSTGSRIAAGQRNHALRVEQDERVRGR